MRRTKTVFAVVAVMAAMLVAFAAPAMANDHRDWYWDDRHDDDSCWFWGVWVCDDNDRDRFDRDRFDLDDGFFFGDNEQEAESGDIDQDFDVSGTGDNSNQCLAPSFVTNTGNAQNQIGVTDFGNFDNDNGDRWWNGGHFDNGNFEFDDVGSSIVVSPANITSSDQEVNQAASAFDGRRW